MGLLKTCADNQSPHVGTSTTDNHGNSAGRHDLNPRFPVRDETHKNGQVVKEKIEIKGGRSVCTVAAIRTEVDQRGM